MRFLLGVVDESAELHDAATGLDVDLPGLGHLIVDQGDLHRGREHAVVNDLAGRLLGAGGGVDRS
jgi:hypothetical protein